MKNKEVHSIIIKSENNTNPYFDLMKPIEKESKQIKNDNYAIEIAPPYPFYQLVNLFKMNTYHARCCRVKAALTCILGYQLITDDLDKKPDDIHKKITQWLNNHSQYTAQPLLTTLYNFCLDYELFGNASFEIVRNKKGDIAEFYHIPMKNCSLKKEKYQGDYIINLVQKIGSNTVTFVQFGKKKDSNNNEYLMLKNYSPESDYYGVPEYMPALAAMVLDASANKFNIKRFDNNMLIETVITVIGAAFGNKTEKDIRNFFSNNFKGLDNVGKSLLLQIPDATQNEVSVKIDKIASEIKEASFRALRQDNKEEVIAAHGVPPRLVGIMTASQLGGAGEMKEQMRMFRDITIKPRQMMLEFVMNQIILKNAFPDNNKWKIQFETFDISDASDDADYYYKIMSIVDEYGRKPLTSDEIREEQGYPPRNDKPIDNNISKEEIIKAAEGGEFLAALIQLRDAIKKSML